MPTVDVEVACWRQCAAAIPAGRLRDDAEENLRSCRLNTEGAALFAILPRHRHTSLVRLLVSYQTALDYLDTLSEHPCPQQRANGVQLHRALVEALDPGGPVSDYYLHHPWRNDGGYLRKTVEVSRSGCLALPAYARVREQVLDSAGLMTVQSLNHDPDPRERDAGLRSWAASRFPGRDELAWFEWTAASCSSLCTLALLALAAEPDLREEDVAAAQAVYFPWVCAASTLLDAFVDQAADRAAGNHSYVEHYDSETEMVDRLCEITHRSVAGARQLRDGERHALIVAGMVAMYLSKASARGPELRAASARIARAAGSLPRIQLPIMRAMRAVQHLGDA